METDNARRRRGAILLGSVLVSLSIVGSTVAAQADVPAAGQSSEVRAKYKRCRDVIIRNGDGSVFTRTRGLFHKRASCRVARKVAHAYMSFEGEGGPPRPRGFKCSGGSDGVACKKGRKKVTWGYYIS